MTVQVLDQAARAERRRPARRWSDFNPLSAGSVVMALTAWLIHALPVADSVLPLRRVLTGAGVVTAALLAILFLMQRCARPASGHSALHHPGRRGTDRRQG